MKERTVERWGVLELEFTGKKDKNPFTDYRITGCFSGGEEEVRTDGFYDGDGVYKIRFMPSFTGKYTYRVEGDFSEESYSGEFWATEPGENNHGPVKAAGQYHFAYADGMPYYEVGTTAYAWVFQEEERQVETLRSLERGPFNKIRFCIFPKHYDYNLHEPVTYPYEGKPCKTAGMNRDNFWDFAPDNPENQWDFTRFHPGHFRMFDERIGQLMELGIEADLILFHPYDRWGFSMMGQEADDRYLRYMAARYGAYRNVWWSLANEYDLCRAKTEADWDRMGYLLCDIDPYHRLRSIHNCHHIYDFTKPWITHCSIQRTEIYTSAARAGLWRMQYQKPVVLDEVGYEGDIDRSWGNLTAEEMVRLFWVAAVRGAYCGHGETYVHPSGRLWWSHGGRLRGDSPDRLEFLKSILYQVPGHGLEPANMRGFEDDMATAAHFGFKDRFYLYYSGNTRPGFKRFSFPRGTRWHVEVIDTWNMTVEDRGIMVEKFDVELPARLYMAVRLTKI